MVVSDSQTDDCTVHKRPLSGRIHRRDGDGVCVCACVHDLCVYEKVKMEIEI